MSDNALDMAAEELEKALNSPKSHQTLSELASSPPPSGWTPDLVLILSISLLIFGLFVFIITAYLVNKNHDSSAILKITALPLIIISATFLIVVGYSQEQIAPVIGLLGTVAGYLLGNKSEQPPKKTSVQISEASENN